VGSNVSKRSELARGELVRDVVNDRGELCVLFLQLFSISSVSIGVRWSWSLIPDEMVFDDNIGRGGELLRGCLTG
jgi:hypothetical protein